MDVTYLIDYARSVHFRKVFYLISIVLVAILLVLKYKLLPQINRRENLTQRILRRIFDTLVVLTFCTMAVASIFFWMSGNE
ncbi:hypothetical protein [Mucilaginibacter phyllosphaerae]|uniref:Uncharacterized protein n=1 Tax=Mucilaginibacter phyllosphaerae TaxID=1812349 RepID=A0ABR6I8R8_9SPHI|nr:hypothetical protein [Mucilaginibacter phyllosphaerae]MBB3969446.1 hypothetical protein [Mucilaginibacter phyllosphaerae]